MKVMIDGDLCSGHGRCWVVAQDVYVLDDNGYNAERGRTINVVPGREEAARLGAARCPERAIQIVED